MAHSTRDLEYVRGAVFFFQAEDGIRDLTVTGVQTCALPILSFFFTDDTSRSAKLLDGRTSAHATRKPHNSSTANSVCAIRLSRGTPVYAPCPRMARHIGSGTPCSRNSPTPHAG